MVVWILNICGAPCECITAYKNTTALTVSIWLSTFLSILLWIIGSGSFIFGGHGQSLICKPLFQHNFEILSQLFDKTGAFYPNYGFFGSFIKGNTSLDIQSILR